MHPAVIRQVTVYVCVNVDQFAPGYRMPVRYAQASECGRRIRMACESVNSPVIAI